MAEDNSNCGKVCAFCNKAISLVAQSMPCKCGAVFCEKHRQAEKHNCKHNFQEEQRQNLRKANPQVYKASTQIHTEEQWMKEFWKHNDPRCRYSLWQSVGVVILFWFVVVRGLFWNFLFGGIAGDEWGGIFVSGVGAPPPLKDVADFDWKNPQGAASSAKKVDLSDPSTFSDLFGEQDSSSATKKEEKKAEPSSTEDRLAALERQNRELMEQLRAQQTGSLAGSSTPNSTSNNKSRTSNPFFILLQQTFYGLVLGYLTAHAVPHLLDKYVDQKVPKRPLLGGTCRFSFFSWDVFSNPWFALLAEWEMIKDHILFHFVTFGRTNCLSYLYTGQDRSVGYLYGKVKDRLVELQQQR